MYVLVGNAYNMEDFVLDVTYERSKISGIAKYVFQSCCIVNHRPELCFDFEITSRRH